MKTDEELYNEYIDRLEAEDRERFQAEDDEIEGNYMALKDFYGEQW